MKLSAIRTVLFCLAVFAVIPVSADQGDSEWRTNRHERDRYDREYDHDRFEQERRERAFERERERDRYERERDARMGRERYNEGYRNGGCRDEGWYDRDGYYHVRRVCPETQVVIPVPVPGALPFPPGLPLPPGVHFR